MATQRIYLVGTPDNKIRLVKAGVRSQALSHVANSMLTIRVASQDDLVEALKGGVEVENARSQDQMEIDDKQ
jgi:hypothetical protein